MIVLFDKIHKTKFPISEEERSSLCRILVEEHLAVSKTNHYKERGNNFYLTFQPKLIDDLNSFFLEKSKEVYDFAGNYTLGGCWIYVSNHEDYDERNCIHNHAKRCAINAVYYLNVPAKDSGSISFFNDEDKKVFEYQPENFDFLIMPSYVKHNPEKSFSKDYRIAVSLEIVIN